jgi:hypothetical protein
MVLIYYWLRNDKLYCIGSVSHISKPHIGFNMLVYIDNSETNNKLIMYEALCNKKQELDTDAHHIIYLYTRTNRDNGYYILYQKKNIKHKLFWIKHDDNCITSSGVFLHSLDYCRKSHLAVINHCAYHFQ